MTWLPELVSRSKKSGLLFLCIGTSLGVIVGGGVGVIAAGDVTVITNVLRVEILGRHLRIRSQSGTIFNSKAIITARYFDRKRKMVFNCVITGVSARKPKTQCLMPKSLQKAAKQRRAVFQISTG